jgi:spore coat protein JC
MWSYNKRLQYPVKIAQTNPQLAKLITTQYGGPDGEMGASLRYLSQRYTMPYAEIKGILTDIGTGVSYCSEAVSPSFFPMFVRLSFKFSIT